jgi:uncharacterized protein YbcI
MPNKPKEEIASIAGEAMRKFLERHMGEKIKEVFAQVVDDAIIVRSKGVFPPAENALCRDDKGIKLIKELKEKLMERAKPLLKTMIEDMAGTKVLDIHSSVNPQTGEHVAVFILDKKL